MAKISVITPLHEKGNQYIEEAMRSLKAQTFQDFEWTILRNNGGVPPYDVLIYDKADVWDYFGIPNIGALKKKACEYATGEIIVELDADDQLMPNALEEINKALCNDKVFFYSESFEIKPDGSSHLYSPYYGWETATKDRNGKPQEYNLSFPVNPNSLRQIFWAPNHVRAWTKEAYDAIGGHDKDLEVGDDHDLIMRFYIAYGRAGFYQHDEPLYIYRVHPGNTFQEKAQKIAEQSWNNYDRHMHKILLRWAEDNKLLALDLGARFSPTEGMKSVDRFPPCDIMLDLSLDNQFGWGAIPNNTIGYIRASDFVEHMKDPIRFMNQAWRVLAPGGWLRIAVPSTDGRGAFQDPTHVSFWNLNSFWYYTNEKYAKYIQPEFFGRFQVGKLTQGFPTEWHKENNIPYVYADLIVLKDNKPIGESLWPR